MVSVRPITETGGHDVVTHDDSSSSLIIGADRSFTFDYIFSHNSEQISVYETLVLSLVRDCLQGINATVLAYGQTGSGKTYTMGTAYEFEGAELPRSAGIIPRAFVDLFKHIELMEAAEVNVEAQFVEVLYNEELHDLLTPKKNIVKVQEKSGGGIYLSGATTVTLHSALSVLRSGGYSRSTASTKMNAQSSRSHAILTLLVNQKKKDELISSKFHFVDLAGSERLGRTGAEGDRAKEGIKINYGLLALGNVINALSENQRHIPYRDSKLTRLLCDSLGGNSRTVLIACISPADIDLGESVNTLQYATRAKKIRNVISVNIDNLSSADAAVLKKLMAENRRLRQQLKTRGVPCQVIFRSSRLVLTPKKCTEGPVLRGPHILPLKNGLQVRSRTLCGGLLVNANMQVKHENNFSPWNDEGGHCGEVWPSHCRSMYVNHSCGRG
ncbi:unnamed protein product [Schistocephalus solidus]|uniref:Kinesin-like protein n=1 Tax=Schistocephalus solidus TaxID=70667 RepID=A0A3P7C686_SCHSO|nr:unnamed protein product [Schistocephalus solidus]